MPTLLPQLAELLGLALTDPVVLEASRNRQHSEHEATAGRRGVKTDIENDQPPSFPVGLIGEREHLRGIPAEPIYLRDEEARRRTTLKQNPLRLEHLQDFIDSYKAESRGKRVESERFKRFAYDELMQRDKVSLDLIWLRDDSLEDMDNLPPPNVIAQEIVEDIEAALSEFAAIAESLRVALPKGTEVCAQAPPAA